MSPGAEFELSIDVKPALIASARGSAARLPNWSRSAFRNCDVVVKHLPSGEVTVVAYKPGSRPH